MSRLRAALDRVDNAVRHLETAVTAYQRHSASACERLGAEARSARESYAALQAEARTVSSRLDAAISKLRAVMEG